MTEAIAEGIQVKVCEDIVEMIAHSNSMSVGTVSTVVAP